MHDDKLLMQILEETRHLWDRPETRPAVRKNFTTILQCRTPALGWEVFASDTEEKLCYHTCKSRFCPSCGYRATLVWLDEQEAALLDLPYIGIVFTMPRELWGIFKGNRHLLHDLPVLGAEVIQQWVKARYGASVAIMVVPHTFGGDLKFNVHLHILISAGGLRKSDAQWIPRLWFDEDELMRRWREAVITHLRNALKAQVLKSNRDVKELRGILTSAHERHPRWIIFLKKFESKSHFLRYAARYVRRPPSAKWRLLKVTEGEVLFLAKDTRAQKMVRTRCPVSDFLRLLAAHVPEVYRHAIRYFGLLAPRTKALSYAALFVLLEQKMRTRPQRLSWRASLLKWLGRDPLVDSHGQVMRWVRQEPPLRA
jgi:Putative transposase/Transposase zinc-binding domain